MSGIAAPPRTEKTTRAERPKLYKVILLNDDFTPRDLVVEVLKGIFRMTESEAPGVMPTAHRRGASVVAVFTREVAETKARQGNDAGQSAGYPLTFTTEREDWESRENAIPGRWLAIFGHVPRVQACRCMAHAYNFQEIGARREPAIC